MKSVKGIVVKPLKHDKISSRQWNQTFDLIYDRILSIYYQCTVNTQIRLSKVITGDEKL